MTTEKRPEPRPEHRIAKLLARAGIASRREIERMIADGRVALDGTVLDTPATVLPSLRGVTVDGDPVEAAEAARLFVYHKPPGLLVTERDPAGRPTIYDRLPTDLPRVVPVGRLDLATEGLLLLTTDGGLKRTLELPASGVERAYRARAYGEITQARLEDLMDGVEIEGVRYGPINANLERRTGANVWIELILTEGKNREVRRVLEYLGLQVSRLIRTRYGPFILADLPAGAIGEVCQNDLVAFTKALKDGRSSDVRVEPVEPRTSARGTRTPQTVARRPRPERTTAQAGAAPARTAPAHTAQARTALARTAPARSATVRAPQPGAASSQSAPARPARAKPERIRPTTVTERGDAANPWTRPQPGERPARPATHRATPTRRDDRDRGEPLSTSPSGPPKVKHFRAAKPPRNAVASDARPAAPLDRRAARSARGRPTDDGTPRPPRAPRPAQPGKGPSAGRGHPPRAPRGGKR
ncbi:pseudouridine synthase [Sphingomonas sp.]|uniref:pseudouridine synthase n=1 Tax=Sphingomonas sp. TaxID=28214 RepID=UPI0035BBADD9